MENILTITDFRKIIEKDYNDYYSFVYKAAYGFLKNQHNAEDLTSDIFTKIWSNENITFKDNVNIKGWLRTVTFNEYLSQHNKKKTLKDYVAIDTLKTSIHNDNVVTSLKSILLIGEYNQHDDVVYKELELLIKENLSENDLFYFEKQFIEGLPYNEIMKEADVTLAVVKNKVHFLRKKIIKILEENNYEL